MTKNELRDEIKSLEAKLEDCTDATKRARLEGQLAEAQADLADLENDSDDREIEVLADPPEVDCFYEDDVWAR